MFQRPIPHNADFPEGSGGAFLPSATGRLDAQWISSALQNAWNGPPGVVIFDTPFDLSLVASLSYGKTHSSFPQPNGERIDVQFMLGTGLGLKYLHWTGFERSVDSLCLILQSMKEGATRPQETRLYWNSTTGYERSEQRAQRLVREALAHPGETLAAPIDITCLVSLSSGVLNATFPAPYGGNSGKQRSFGAANRLTSVKLMSVVVNNNVFELKIDFSTNSPSKVGTSTLFWSKEHGYETRLRRAERMVAEVLRDPSLLKNPLDVFPLIRTDPCCIMIENFPEPSVSVVDHSGGKAIGIGSGVTAIILTKVEREGDEWKLSLTATREGRPKNDSVVVHWNKERGYHTARERLVDQIVEALKTRGPLKPPLEVTDLIHLKSGKLSVLFPSPEGKPHEKFATLAVGENLTAVRLVDVAEVKGIYLLTFEYEQAGQTNRTPMFWSKDVGYEYPFVRSARLLSEAFNKPEQFTPPLDITPLFTPSTGDMSSAFPTPDRSHACRIGIGFGNDFTKVELAGLTNLNGVWRLDINVSTPSKQTIPPSSTPPPPVVESYTVCWEQGYGYETLRTKTERLFRAHVDDAVPLIEPLDISPLVRLTKGLLAESFPTPGGGSTLKRMSFHAPADLEWVKLRAIAINGEVTKLTLQIKPRKADKPYNLPLFYTEAHGYETLLKKTVREVQEVYAKGKVESPLDVSCLFSLPIAAMSLYFPTPTGEKLAGQEHIGTTQALEHVRLIGLASEDKTLRLDFSYKIREQDGEQHVSLFWNAESKHLETRFKHAITLAKLTLADPEHTDLPIEISPIVELGSGTISVAFPGPNGARLKDRFTFGAGYPLSRVDIADVQFISPGQPLITLRYVKQPSMGGSVEGHSGLLWDGERYQVIREKSGLYGAVLRGKIFDHLLALALLDHSPDLQCSRPFFVSEFSQETRIPNVVIPGQPAVLFHGKWGRRTAQCFELFLAYERLHLLHPSAVSPVTLVVVADESRNVLRSLTRATGIDFKGRIISINELLEEIEASPLRRREIQATLMRARHLATNGDFEDLRELEEGLAHRVPPITGGVSGAPTLDRTEIWQAHLNSLMADLPRLYRVIEPHRAIHSMMWDSQYHLRMVAYLSYCLDRLPREGELREIALGMYPALNDYEPREVWEKLVSLSYRGIIADAEQFNEEVGRSSSVTIAPFDLSRYMRMMDRERVQISPSDSVAIKVAKFQLPNDEHPVTLLRDALAFLDTHQVAVTYGVVHELSLRIAHSVRNVLTTDPNIWTANPTIAALKGHMMPSLGQMVSVLTGVHAKHFSMQGSPVVISKIELLELADSFSKKAASILDARERGLRSEGGNREGDLPL